VGVLVHLFARATNHHPASPQQLTDLAEHADAVCLQGYWLPYQVMKLQAILTPYLAHSYSATPAASLCSCNATNGELVPLTTCLSTCASLYAPPLLGICSAAHMARLTSNVATLAVRQTSNCCADSSACKQRKRI
jgi:hypothetical protein